MTASRYGWTSFFNSWYALYRASYDHLCSKQENGLTLRERRFLEEYSKIAKKQGKDAVIRRENKTKRRKKKKRP